MAFNFRKAGGLLGGMMQPDDGQQPGGMGGLLGSLLGRTAAGAAGPFTPPAGIPELPQSAPMPEAAPAKPASFWEGGDKFGWRDGAAGALAAIGDAFAQQNGADGGSVAMLSQGRAAKLAADKAMRAAEAKRATDFQDWQTREQWKLDHPATVNNDTVNDFNWYKGLSPEDRSTYREMKPLYRVGPDGQYYPMAPDLGQQGAPPPTAPQGRLTPIPDADLSPAPNSGVDNNPEVETMRRLYGERFPGPQGEAMFQEWLRNNNRGGR